MEKFSEDILTRDGLCRLIGGFDDLWRRRRSQAADIGREKKVSCIRFKPLDTWWLKALQLPV